MLQKTVSPLLKAGIKHVYILPSTDPICNEWDMLAGYVWYGLNFSFSGMELSRQLSAWAINQLHSLTDKIFWIGASKVIFTANRLLHHI